MGNELPPHQERPPESSRLWHKTASSWLLTAAAILVWTLIGLLAGIVLSTPHNGTQPPGEPTPPPGITTHP